MDVLIDPAKVAALSPENLLAVFRALLLIEESVNHFGNHLSIGRGELIEPISDDIGIGYAFECGIGRGYSGEGSNIGVRSAA